jgi:hypothetical protein
MRRIARAWRAHVRQPAPAPGQFPAPGDPTPSAAPCPEHRNRAGNATTAGLEAKSPNYVQIAACHHPIGFGCLSSACFHTRGLVVGSDLRVRLVAALRGKTPIVGTDSSRHTEDVSKHVAELIVATIAAFLGGFLLWEFGFTGSRDDPVSRLGAQPSTTTRSTPSTTNTSEVDDYRYRLAVVENNESDTVFGAYVSIQRLRLGESQPDTVDFSIDTGRGRTHWFTAAPAGFVGEADEYRVKVLEIDRSLPGASFDVGQRRTASAARINSKELYVEPGYYGWDRGLDVAVFDLRIHRRRTASALDSVDFSIFRRNGVRRHYSRVHVGFATTVERRRLVLTSIHPKYREAHFVVSTIK